MSKPYGARLALEDFEESFQETISDVLGLGPHLYEVLRPYFRPSWQPQSLDVVIVNNSEIGAEASSDGTQDTIEINLGTIEKLYGTFFGLMSLPTFLPELGQVHVEAGPTSLPKGFTPIPMLLDSYKQSEPIYFPNCQRRVTIAMLLAHLACEFLAFHEIGHLVAGHHGLINPDRLMRQIFEIDADLFSCHIASLVQSDAELSEFLRSAIAADSWDRHFAMHVIYLISTGVLFRTLNHDSSQASSLISTYPHPAVRSMLLGSTATAISAAREVVTEDSIREIIWKSVDTVEDAWAEYELPGHRANDQQVWATEVKKAAMELFQSYIVARPTLENHCRVDRRWDVWPSI